MRQNTYKLYACDHCVVSPVIALDLSSHCVVCNASARHQPLLLKNLVDEASVYLAVEGVTDVIGANDFDIFVNILGCSDKAMDVVETEADVEVGSVAKRGKKRKTAQAQEDSQSETQVFLTISSCRDGR